MCPLWSQLIYTEKRLSNSHIESYFSIIKRRCREASQLGKLPTKCLRLLKEVNVRNSLIFDKFKSEIPKRSLKNLSLKSKKKGIP